MKNNVIVHGYTGWYAVKPKIEIYIKGELIGQVSYRDTFEFSIEEDCEVEFKCSIRKTKIKVYKDKKNIISLEFNRFWGTLNANYRGE